MYVVGHDIKPGTWHTAGNGSASGGQCAYAVIGSANALQRNIYFDGPWTVDLSGAYAFRDQRALHVGARAIVMGATV